MPICTYHVPMVKKMFVSTDLKHYDWGKRETDVNELGYMLTQKESVHEKCKIFLRVLILTLIYLVPNERQIFILSNDKDSSFEISGSL